MRRLTFLPFFKLSFITKIVLWLAFILFLVISFLLWFGNVATPKLTHIAHLNMNRYMEQIASDFKIYSFNSTEQILTMKENEKGEIVSIDYDMDSIYKISNEFTNFIQEKMKLSDKNLSFPYNENDLNVSGRNGIFLSLPLGIVSDSVFLVNIGPKIPVYINLIGSVFTQIKTRVKDYGINNALLEIYLDVSITYELITPVTFEEKELTYELLIDSNVVQGKVPNWYGNGFESKSAFFNISIN